MPWFVLLFFSLKAFSAFSVISKLTLCLLLVLFAFSFCLGLLQRQRQQRQQLQKLRLNYLPLLIWLQQQPPHHSELHFRNGTMILTKLSTGNTSCTVAVCARSERSNTSIIKKIEADQSNRICNLGPPTVDLISQ